MNLNGVGFSVSLGEGLCEDFSWVFDVHDGLNAECLLLMRCLEVLRTNIYVFPSEILPCISCDRNCSGVVDMEGR